jgi:hypothetical protein
MKIKGEQLLYFILLGPIVSGVVRKVTPGQPTAVEATTSVVFLVLLAMGLFRINRPSSPLIAHLALIWLILVLVYSIPAAAMDLALAAQSFLLASVGPLLALATLNRASGHQAANSLDAMRLFSYVIAAQVFVGVVMLQYGNDALPSIFRANVIEISVGKEFRIGQPMLAGYFTTAPVNSIVSMCAFGVACSLFLRGRSLAETVTWLIVCTILFVVVWMTARRGALFACAVIGVITILISVMKPKGFALWVSIVPASIMILFFMFAVSDGIELLLGDRLILVRTGGLDLGERFSEVFLRFLLYWLDQAPFGNFTGFASGVGKAFGTRDLDAQPAEVGAAMIVAEHGIVGLLIFLSVFIGSLWEMIRRVQNSGEKWLWPMIGTYFSLFTLFFFKENSAMFPGLFGYLFFWALPGVVIMFSDFGARENRRVKTVHSP